MPLFIVRPKLKFEDRVSGGLPMLDRQLTHDARLRQIDQVSRLLLDDPVSKDLQAWTASQGPTNPLYVKNQSPQMSAVGAAVMDLTDGQAEQLRKDLPNLSVTPDRKMQLIEPSRPRPSVAGVKKKLSPRDRWHLRAVGIVNASGRRTHEYTGKGVTVAVMDTGIAGGADGHKEFKRPNSPGGVIRAAYRFDTNLWKAIPHLVGEDTNGHGTHVAGLVAGATVGVAPNATIIDAAVMPNDGGCNLSDFLLALEWAATDPRIQIVNLSAGIPGFEPGLQEVCERLEAFGVLLVAAVGNEGRNRTRSPGNYRSVLSVGASTPDQRIASFSGSGELIVDNHSYIVPTVVGPGHQVYSCVPGVGNTYEPWDGTSMATPVVSGLAALHLEKDPKINLTVLKELIYENAEYNDDNEPRRQGGGIVRFV